MDWSIDALASLYPVDIAPDSDSESDELGTPEALPSSITVALDEASLALRKSQWAQFLADDAARCDKFFASSAMTRTPERVIRMQENGELDRGEPTIRDRSVFGTDHSTTADYSLSPMALMARGLVHASYASPSPASSYRSLSSACSVRSIRSVHSPMYPFPADLAAVAHRSPMARLSPYTAASSRSSSRQALQVSPFAHLSLASNISASSIALSGSGILLPRLSPVHDAHLAPSEPTDHLSLAGLSPVRSVPSFLGSPITTTATSTPSNHHHHAHPASPSFLGSPITTTATSTPSNHHHHAHPVSPSFLGSPITTTATSTPSNHHHHAHPASPSFLGSPITTTATSTLPDHSIMSPIAAAPGGTPPPGNLTQAEFEFAARIQASPFRPQSSSTPPRSTKRSLLASLSDDDPDAVAESSDSADDDSNPSSSQPAYESALTSESSVTFETSAWSSVTGHSLAGANASHAALPRLSDSIATLQARIRSVRKSISSFDASAAAAAKAALRAASDSPPTSTPALSPLVSRLPLRAL
ncbi:uncharacterized protein AMSG_03344 [Thecamonas trahens ATCC 50062]|uniref:Uncharacterized protein n=1 Tax=Thecamonas trahens ATCC 50062 TaxID=461836 RepID=A0A0L0D6I0_THETB|nr:hypothetical protein AMSG_03344 [Thecamonas trahens ATCC 50062]KNC46913.1 hypothetical protein AMSG_03344 [Thecamonas trahens ATCC 50062]|eukprot:XP_013760186.1 hypothetical protein AMSG_03344 [Thecamonas trahens ATCC 50062]